MDTIYELHSSGQMPGRWFFSRELGSGEEAARAELEKARAGALAIESGVKYRVIKCTEELMTW